MTLPPAVRRSAVAFSLLIVSGLAWHLIAQKALADVTFTPLGTFGGTLSYAHDVSADGSVVVGVVSGLPGNTNGLFRWTRERTIIHNETVRSPVAVSDDGLTVVGSRYLPLSTLDEAFRWTPDNGVFEGLGDLPGSVVNSKAFDVSTDGRVIVGSANGGTSAFRWTRESGMIDLGGREAHGITPDGAIIVGFGSLHAFRWTSETGMIELDRLTDATSSIGYAISADGSAVVGASNFPVGLAGARPEATRWTEGGNVISLEPANWLRTYAVDVSADGAAIVGGGIRRLAGGSTGNGAFYWSDQNGLVDLQETLLLLGVTNLDGWELQGASGISADGLTIVGTGSHNGHPEGWMATVPEPSTIVLVVFVAAIMLCICVARTGV
jgi:probable HAF family extracellular repeat protein